MDGRSGSGDWEEGPLSPPLIVEKLDEEGLHPSGASHHEVLVDADKLPPESLQGGESDRLIGQVEGRPVDRDGAAEHAHLLRVEDRGDDGLRRPVQLVEIIPLDRGLHQGRGVGSCNLPVDE